ncbi:MAG: efflux RND transporter permease subunit, partial [Planctomycetales bacterium]|nr:efflux RND transporter permease subunit [Planctomycetales bacterium]
TLHEKFGDGRVQGDTRALLTPALRTVGRPIFFSLAIMILSFIPVFAMTGMEGKMFHPLAYTKSFALIGVSILAITLVPAIIPWMLRGRIRHESDSWLVRRVIEIYRPVLNFVMDHPWPIVWTVSTICILGSIPTGSKPIFSLALTLALGLAAWASWGEEASFRQHWKKVALGWMLAIVIPLFSAIARGWRATFLPTPWLTTAWPSIVVVLVGSIAVSLCLVWALSRLRYAATVSMVGSLMLIALVAQQTMLPLGREFMPPLNEGSILDMPVTIPRASVTEVAADLKARDAELRAFPEIELVVGKAGRAETPTDPAPLDMVETVINLRDRKFWPKRELHYEDAMRQVDRMVDALAAAGYLTSNVAAPPAPESTAPESTAPESIVDEEAPQADTLTLTGDVTMLVLEDFDAAMRSIVLQEQKLFEDQLAPQLMRAAVGKSLQLMQANGSLTARTSAELAAQIVDSIPPDLQVKLIEYSDVALMQKILSQVRGTLREAGVLSASVDPSILKSSRIGSALRSARALLGGSRPTFETVVLEHVTTVRDERWTQFVRQLNWRLLDTAIPLITQLALEHVRSKAMEANQWIPSADETQLAQLKAALEKPLSDELFLWQRDKSSLLAELDSVVRMPGWGNIWTQPIINRIDMLATGVSTMLGVRVFGDDIDGIAEKCDEIASVLKQLRGAVDVSADQVVGEGYLEIDIDRQRAARFGINIGDIQDTIEIALGGRVITTTVEGRERFPVRIRYARAFRDDEESVKNLLIAASSGGLGMSSEAGPRGATSSSTSASKTPLQIPLSQVADIRIVQGPSMIRSENGLLRSYVRLNVRDRDIMGFVEEAQATVNSTVNMPTGMYVEWTGQFEHADRARRTLSIIVPAVVVTIFVLLYIVYHDLADTLIVMCLTVPGAIFGGILFQYLFGYNFSVAVWVGFIACFGLATEGGLVILVYLRQAIEQRGGLENLSLEQVREAVMEGAVHRLRPKLMTELTTMIGLAPMLWATGTGA